MSLEDIEREDEDRIQFEMQLFGQGGNKTKARSYDKKHKRQPEVRPGRVRSGEDYILTLEKVKR
jgi:hypothetical protein